MRIAKTFFNLPLQRRIRLGMIALGLALIGISFILPKNHQPPSAPEPIAEAPEPIAEAPDQPPDITATDWITHAVQRGDNLGALLTRAGLSPRDVHELVSVDERTARLTRIFPGDEISLQLTEEGRLQAVRYSLNETDTLYVSRNGDEKLESRVETNPLEVDITEATGAITSSLYNAGIQAGLEDRTIM